MDGDKENQRGRPSNWAVTAGVVVIVLLAIAIASFVKARNSCCQNALINNLRMIDSGKQQPVLPAGLTNTVPEKR